MPFPLNKHHTAAIGNDMPVICETLNCCAPSPFDYYIETDPCEAVDDLEITTTELPEGNEDEAYEFQMEATGGTGDYIWTITGGTLPDGLTMDAAGLITGTPTGAGSSEITFSVADTGCSLAAATTDLTIVVNPEDPCGPLPAVSLVAYYKCNDVAFPYVDSLAGKNMTAVAGSAFPTVEPGIISTGFFNLAGVGSGSWGRNTDAQWELTGEAAFTLRAWFWYSGTSSTIYDTIVNSTGARYAIYMFDPFLGPVFKFQIRGSAGYTHKHYAAIPGVGWHRVIGIFRNGCGSYLKIDNNATTFFPDAIGLFPGSTFFEIQLPNALFAYPKTGVDEVGVWRGAWSETQMLYDWNSGAGRTYPDVP